MRTVRKALERALPLALLVGGMTSCQAPAPASSQTAAAESAPPVAEASAWNELQALDPRTPVPLLPQMAWHQKQNMQDHLLVVQEVLAAVVRDDFEGAAKAAARMGLSDSMQQQCEHMGQGAPGFTERAIAFHKQADLVVSAARAGDRAGVLRELSSTITHCTSCHASFKQEVVSPAEWSARVGSDELPTPMGMHHHHAPPE